jgi:hypothetical protein
MASSVQQYSKMSSNLNRVSNSIRSDASDPDDIRTGKCRAIVFDMFSILAVLVYRWHSNGSARITSIHWDW